MFCIGNLASSTVIISYLKSEMMPYFFMIFTPRTRSYCGLLFLSYSRISGSARYLLLSEYSKKFSSISAYVWSKTSHSKYSTTVEPAFLRREAAWVCICLRRQGCHQNQSLTGPALVFVCIACYYVGGGDCVWVYPSSQLLQRWSCPQVGLC